MVGRSRSADAALDLRAALKEIQLDGSKRSIFQSIDQSIDQFGSSHDRAAQFFTQGVAPTSELVLDGPSEPLEAPPPDDSSRFHSHVALAIVLVCLYLPKRERDV